MADWMYNHYNKLATSINPADTSRRSRRLNPQTPGVNSRASRPSHSQSRGRSANRREPSTSRPRHAPLWRVILRVILLISFVIVLLSPVLPDSVLFWRTSIKLAKEISAGLKSDTIHYACKFPVALDLAACPNLESTTHGLVLERARQHLESYRHALSNSPGSGDQVVLRTYDQLRKILDELATIEIDIGEQAKNGVPGAWLLKRYDHLLSSWKHHQSPFTNSYESKQRDLADSFRRSNDAMEKMVTRFGILVGEFEESLKNIMTALGINSGSGLLSQQYLGYLYPDLGDQIDTLRRIGEALKQRHVNLRQALGLSVNLEHLARNKIIGSIGTAVMKVTAWFWKAVEDV